MKKLYCKLGLVGAVQCLILLVAPAGAIAAEQGLPEPDERLQRLEQRVKELADRQEELLGRLGGPPARQGPMVQPGMMPMPRPMGQSVPGYPGRLKILQELGSMLRLVLLALMVCNILLAIWIYGDIRRRGEGSGIFIALALVAGIPAAIIYSLVRLGDRIPTTGK